MKSCDIHMRAVSQEMLKTSIFDMSLDWKLLIQDSKASPRGICVNFYGIHT